MSIIPFEPQTIYEKAIIEELTDLQERFGELSALHLDKKHSTFVGIFATDDRSIPTIFHHFLSKTYQFKKVISDLLLDARQLHRINPNNIQPVIMCSQDDYKSQRKAEELAQAFQDFQIPYIGNIFILKVNSRQLLQTAIEEQGTSDRIIRESFELLQFPTKKKDRRKFIKTLLRGEPRTKESILQLIGEQAEMDMDELTDIIDLLARAGDVYQPHPDHYKALD